jgi:hypothetical protein
MSTELKFYPKGGPEHERNTWYHSFNIAVRVLTAALLPLITFWLGVWLGCCGPVCRCFQCQAKTGQTTSASSMLCRPGFMWSRTSQRRWRPSSPGRKDTGQSASTPGCTTWSTSCWRASWTVRPLLLAAASTASCCVLLWKGRDIQPTCHPSYTLHVAARRPPVRAGVPAVPGGVHGAR